MRFCSGYLFWGGWFLNGKGQPPFRRGPFLPPRVAPGDDSPGLCRAPGIQAGAFGSVWLLPKMRSGPLRVGTTSKVVGGHESPPK